MFRHQSRKPLLAITLAALLGTTACVSSTDFNRLRNQVYYQEQERQKQEERMAMLEGQLAQQVQPMQSAQANSWAEINAMRQQLATLTGQMEDVQLQGGGASLAGLNAKVQELEHKIAFMSSQLGVTFDEMPAPSVTAPSTMPSATMPADTAPPMGMTVPPPTFPQQTKTQTQAQAPGTSAPPAVSQPEPTPPASGQELYQQALEGFYAKQYQQAQMTWDQFVQGFPKDPLVPNAIFWQGECFFQMQDYANAVLTYQKVIEDHSSSNKFKSALLKQGISFFKLKKDQAGKLVLEDLIKKYPDSAEAKRAQAYLKSGQ